jgi:hypothetical protein
MILDRRPERTAVLLSLALTSGAMIYSFGETPDNGITFAVPLTKGTLNVTKNELGDAIALPMWNVTGGSRNLSISESWAVPTGQCVCDELDGWGCPPRDDTYSGLC